jgi:hypothetical protein
LKASWVAALFKKFASIWPGQWEGKFADEAAVDAAMLEWGEALYCLTPEEIRTGIEQSRAKLTWPPTISEFLTMARTGLEQKGAAYKPFQKSLPKPKAEKSLVQKNLASMRQAVGRK